MSLLTMIQDITTSLGVTSKPTGIMNNTDPTIITLLSLANKEGRELAGRYDWQALTKQASFVTTNATNQGTLVSIAGSGFKHIISNTMWDQTHGRPIRGSITKQRWARLEASSAVGTYSEHQVRDKSLYTIPSPGSASATWSFFYYSKYWCQSAASAGQSRWVADDDTGILDEDLMALGVEWRYLKSKGFDYSEEFMSYERRVQNEINQDRDHQMINLETTSIDDGPGTLGVPEGSWPAS